MLIPVSRNLAENPWFWVALFGGMGLLGAIVIGPKFGVRMARVERMQETRERVAQERAQRLTAEGGATPLVEQPPQPTETGAATQRKAEPPKPEPYVESDFRPSESIKYLIVLMMLVMMVGTTGLLITRGRERRAAADAEAANESPSADSSKADS